MYIKPNRFVTVLLVFILICSVLSGCSTNKDADSKQTPAPTKAVDNSPEASDELVTEESSESEPITISYWIPFDSSALEYITGYAENTAWIELQNRTGIKIEFIHPASGQEDEQFNLMIASKDIPDIVSSVERYKGGPAIAINDGLFLDITNMIEEHAPNFMALMNQSPELKKLSYSDDGIFLGFSNVLSDTFGNTTEPFEENPYAGPFIRKDTLDQLNLPIPGTVEEWYNTLTAMKETGEFDFLITFPNSGVNTLTGVFLTAFDVAPEFYQVDGKVKYGPIEEGYLDYLTEMKKWYDEGLIDPEFATRDSNSSLALISTGKVAAVHQQSPSFIKAQKENGYTWTGAPIPQISKDKPTHWRLKNNVAGPPYTLISSTNKHPIESMKLLDYGYSLEGLQLFCFGIDGVDYNGLDENGCPNYIEEYVTADGNAVVWTNKRAVFRMHGGSYLKSDKRSNPNRWDKNLEQWRENWFTTPTDYVLPPITLTIEENAESSDIMTDISTYVKESTVNFIMGIEPLENYVEFVENIKKLNIDKAIAFRQAALERFNSR